MKKSLLILFLFSQILYGFSQTNSNNEKFEISGLITDSITKNSLDFVNLVLLKSEDGSFVKSTLSNVSGRFLFKEIPLGVYLLRVNFIGYNSNITNINLTENTILDIPISKLPENLESVTVNATKQIYKLEPDKRVYLTANDESIQGAFASDAIENAPGVFLDATGAVLVRNEKAEILINGRSVNKSEDHLKEYLATIPAFQIEKIEVITNPSAAYSASNKNYIINIVLKKHQIDDRLFAFGAKASTTPSYDCFVNFFIRKKKFDFNIYTQFFQAKRTSNSMNESYSYQGNDTLFYDKYSNQSDVLMQGGNINSTFSYRFSDKNSISANIDFSLNKLETTEKNSFLQRFENPAEQNIVLKNNSTNNSLSSVINFVHSFNKEGSALNIDLYHTLSIDDLNYNYDEKNINNESELLRKSNKKSTDQYIYIDSKYTLPINDNNAIEFGINALPYLNNYYKNLVDTSSVQIKTWQNCPELSHKYSIDNTAIEIYSQYSGKISIINYVVGLRYEYNYYKLNQIEPEYKLKNSFQNLYPSLSLSYATETNNNFSLSYSRRVDNPVSYLNPYIDRTNKGYLSSGNPNLNLASTNSIDFTYFKGFEKMELTISLYHKNTQNYISTVTEPFYDDFYEQTVVLQTYANCADYNLSGSELSLSISAVKNFRISFNTNGFYKQIKGEYKNEIIDNHTFVYTSQIGIMYNFGRKLSFRLSPNYVSDESGFFQKSKNQYSVNCSLKLNLWEKRVSVDIRVRDIFNTYKKSDEYYNSEFYQYSEQKYQSQYAQFVIIYKLGNRDFEGETKINNF